MRELIQKRRKRINIKHRKEGTRIQVQRTQVLCLATLYVHMYWYYFNIHSNAYMHVAQLSLALMGLYACIPLSVCNVDSLIHK